MYLKLHDKPEPPNLPAYVYQTIRSIFIDEYRRSKKIKTVDAFVFVQESCALDVEVNCQSYTSIDKAVNDIEVNYEELLQDELEFDLVKAVFEKLPDYKKDILRYSYEDGQREFCRLSGIGLNTVTLIRRNFKSEVWKLLKTKNPEQMETLLKETLKKMMCNRARSAEKDGLF
jgi:DNA-directed RNA polymerase specialized sigma24 family protein